MKFAEKLKKAMQELNLNQRQVVTMTGKSKGSVSQYLSGKQIPSEDVQSAIAILCVAAVHDEFGFGEKRCRRLIAKMEEGAEYLMDDLATWNDYINEIKDQLNIDLRIRWND